MHQDMRNKNEGTKCLLETDKNLPILHQLFYHLNSSQETQLVTYRSEKPMTKDWATNPHQARDTIVPNVYRKGNPQEDTVPQKTLAKGILYWDLTTHPIENRKGPLKEDSHVLLPLGITVVGHSKNKVASHHHWYQMSSTPPCVQLQHFMEGSPKTLLKVVRGFTTD
ncbi:hypothetical protein DSO57_1015908 [Entomophthora muscae]|uniref:Uncharacterized protein n=1 Tax=Entomophthora muscae TaxID=34485 RepID=A0ACC2RW33_9FUNG|nr:hypothetical protein DSO57_1015908 [Entomophthora muscae]